MQGVRVRINPPPGRSSSGGWRTITRPFAQEVIAGVIAGGIYIWVIDDNIIKHCIIRALPIVFHHIMLCCIVCNASLGFTASYAICPYYVVRYMQSVLIMYCFVCKVSL